MRAVAVCVLLVVAALAGPALAGAQGLPASTLDANPISTPDLGVDALGGSVVAWVGFAPTTGGGDATVAVGGEGSVLVAWLDGSGRRGCGNVVWAARARPGQAFGGATRVSGPCAQASSPRAALGPDGRGAVAWRARPSGGETGLQAAAFRWGRFLRAREVSRSPISAVEFDIAGDRTGATVAWRDGGG